MSKLWTTLGTVLILTASVSGFVAAQDGDENVRPWLGVSVRDADNGAIVEQVASESPAEAAGIEEGDVIVSFNDIEVTAAQELVELVRGAAVGDTVSLALLRGEEEVSVDVTLAEFPERGPRDPADRPNLGGFNRGEAAFILLGVVAVPVDGGFEILETLPTASESLQAGDIITAINGDSVSDLSDEDLLGMMFALEDPAEVTILRDGEEMTVSVEIAESSISGFSPDGGVMMRGMGAYLGVEYAMLSEEFATNLGLVTSQGALVESVEADSPAAAAGLQAGDIITAIDGELVDDDDPLAEVMGDYEPDETATLTVIRAGEEQQIEVTFGASMRGFPMVPGGFRPDGMPHDFFDYFNRDGEIPFMPGTPRDFRPDRMPLPRDRFSNPMMPDGLSLQMVCRDQDGNMVLMFELGGDSQEFESMFPELDTLQNIEGLECEVVTGEIPADNGDAETEDAPATPETDTETQGA